MKKTLSLILSFALLLSLVPIAIAVSPAERNTITDEIRVTLAADSRLVDSNNTGYIMLLDSTAQAFEGGFLTEADNLGGPGPFPSNYIAPEYISCFDFKIPSTASAMLNSNSVVRGGSSTISITAGTYDFCIANPIPFDHMRIANNSGESIAKRDNYEFEAGYDYTFTVTNSGDDDFVTLTKTPTVEYVYVPATELTDGETYVFGVEYQGNTIIMSNKRVYNDTMYLAGITAHSISYDGQKALFNPPAEAEWVAQAADSEGNFVLQSAAYTTYYLATYPSYGRFLYVAENTDTYWEYEGEGMLKDSATSSPTGNKTHLSYGARPAATVFDVWDPATDTGFLPLELYVREEVPEATPTPEPADIEFYVSANQVDSKVFASVTLSEESGIRSGMLTLTYPDTLLEYADYAIGTLIDDESAALEVNALNSGELVFDFAALQAMSAGGTMVTFEFDIKDYGRANFGLTIDELLSQTLDDLEGAAYGTSLLLLSPSIEPSPSPSPSPMLTYATIRFEADDVWGDGSGYQLLFDKDATAYGNSIYPPLGGNAMVSTGNYNAFEFKLPSNADANPNSTNIVTGGNLQETDIPDGVYDWYIINPSPEDSCLYALYNGRGDDMLFEDGHTYTFSVHANPNYNPNYDTQHTGEPNKDMVTIYDGDTQIWPDPSAPTPTPITSPTPSPSPVPSASTEPTPTQYKVTFVDWDDSVIDEQLVNEGEDAVLPAEPERDYWLFNEWDGDHTNVTNDITIKAMYQMLGDVNMDDTVNTGDAALTLQYCVNPELLSEKQVKLADLNRDGKANTGDAALVLQITVGLTAKPW